MKIDFTPKLFYLFAKYIYWKFYSLFVNSENIYSKLEKSQTDKNFIVTPFVHPKPS